MATLQSVTHRPPLTGMAIFQRYSTTVQFNVLLGKQPARHPEDRTRYHETNPGTSEESSLGASMEFQDFLASLSP